MWPQRFRQFLADLVAALLSLIREPRESLQILRMLPEMLAGARLAKNWADQPSSDHSVAKPDSAESGSLATTSADSVVNPLALYFKNHTKGRGIWKYEHYLDIYHRFFSKFVGKEVHVVEVGIFSGGSLDMWKSYFGSKCKVFGIDIREECKAYADDRVEIFIGDQADRAFWKSFKEKVPPVDIIIDDGGHLPEQQIVTLEEMLPHLRPGGIYLCEDILSDSNRFPAYIYGLLRRLNTFDYRPGDLIVDATPFQGAIHSVHAYPYVTVIERSSAQIGHFQLPMQGTEWAPISHAGTPEISLSTQG
jgi:cephalosporin hydroxylase